MRKILNNPWFVGVAALVALLLVVHVIFPGAKDYALGRSSTPVVSDESESSPEAMHTTTGAIVKSLPIPTIVRDPFAVRVKVEAVDKKPEPDFVDSVHLSAIWTQDGQTLVLINDRICQDGDELGRVKIESATRDGVWLSHWKGRNFLAIGGNFTLNTPARKFPTAAASL